MYYIKVNNLSYCIKQIKNLIYMNLFDTLYNIRLNIAQKYFRKKKISDNFAWTGINEISWERYGQQETDSNLQDNRKYNTC